MRVKNEGDSQAAKISHLIEALSVAQEESEERMKEIERLQEERRRVRVINRMLTSRLVDRQEYVLG